jgi:hypothetical protein
MPQMLASCFAKVAAPHPPELATNPHTETQQRERLASRGSSRGCEQGDEE